MRTAKVILKWVGISFSLAFLAFLAVNLFDERLDPEAASYGKPRPSKVPDRENGYFGLLAMDAPAGVDAMAYAHAWLDEARVAARENRRPNRRSSQDVQSPVLCEPREKSCFAFLRESGKQAQEQIKQLTEALGRYETVLGFKRFEEVLDYPFRIDSDFPRYSTLALAQRAYLSQIAVDIEAGRVEKGIAALQSELAWQRRFLTGSRTLVSKMVAVAGYWRDLMFLADLVQNKSGPDLMRSLPRFREMVLPLDEALASFGAVTEAEFALVSTVFYNLAQEPADATARVLSYLTGAALLYQPNATVNHAYQYYSGLAKNVFGAPASRVTSELHTFSQTWHDLPWWRCIYNPTGKILLSVAMPDWGEYPLRLHDLDALNRLMGLRVELLASGTGPDRVAETVAVADKRFLDPYALKPMRWDPEKRHLYFEAGSARIKELKFGVEGGRVFVVL